MPNSPIRPHRPWPFPPFEINGFLLADGATADNLLVVGQSGPSTLFSDAEVAPGHLYVLHNGRGGTEFEATPRGARQIVSKSLGIIMEAQMNGTLLRAYGVSAVHGYQFRLAQIPPDVPVNADILAFDTEEMRALFVAGRELGRNPDDWQNEPPPSQQVRSWLIKAVSEIPVQTQE